MVGVCAGTCRYKCIAQCVVCVCVCVCPLALVHRYLCVNVHIEAEAGVISQVPPTLFGTWGSLTGFSGWLVRPGTLLHLLPQHQDYKPEDGA